MFMSTALRRYGARYEFEKYAKAYIGEKPAMTWSKGM